MRIESVTVEKLLAKLVAKTDPTGTLPEFQLTSGARSSPDEADWVDGEWLTSWVALNGRVDALTPTIGASGASLTVVEGTTYDLWARVTAGAESPVLWLGTVSVR